MPREVYNVDDFLKLSNNAIECRVKRLKDIAKLKLRTKKYLYTYKVSLAEADGVIKMLRCPIKEIN